MNPIILALDLNTLDEARDMLTKTRDHIGMIKIGPELWINNGPKSLDLGSEFNVPIFLDLKFHDIPNTVERSVSSLIAIANDKKVDLSFISVHASGGREMIKVAIKAASHYSRIAVVTLLTSLDKRDLMDLGFRNRMEGIKTIDLTRFSKEEGATTFVCSPVQIDLMRKHFDEKGYPITLITPGIRAEKSIPDDQKRTKSASFALRPGMADFIVIGRPITQSPNPNTAAKEFHDLAIKAGR